jgi:hypothetical protein
MIIHAFDPGKLTGYVAYSPEAKEVISFSQIPFEHAALEINHILKKATKDDLIVYEKFVISPRTLQFSRQMEPIYCIGMLMYAAAIYGLEGCLKGQMAAAAKTAYPSERLKELGLFDKVVGGHARDGLRHALLASHSVVN